MMTDGETGGLRGKQAQSAEEARGSGWICIYDEKRAEGFLVRPTGTAWLEKVSFGRLERQRPS